MNAVSVATPVDSILWSSLSSPFSAPFFPCSPRSSTLSDGCYSCVCDRDPWKDHNLRSLCAAVALAIEARELVDGGLGISVRRQRCDSDNWHQRWTSIISTKHQRLTLTFCAMRILLLIRWHRSLARLQLSLWLTLVQSSIPFSYLPLLGWPRFSPMWILRM